MNRVKLNNVLIIVISFLSVGLALAQSNPSGQLVVHYRGDARRTGAYSEEGIRQFNGVKWQMSVGQTVHGGVVFANGTIFVLSVDGKLAAIDSSTGNRLWSFTPKPFSPLFSPVAVADGVVYVGQDKRLHALNAQTGKKIWSFKTKGLGISSPLVVGSTVYFGSFDNNFYAVDINTRKLKWKLMVGDTDTHAVFEDGTVFFESADFSINLSYLYAVDAETGKEKWKMERPVSVAWARPAASDGLLYIGQGDRFYALNNQTGEAVWSFQGGTPVWTGPAIADGIVYVGNQDQFVYALDSKTGEPVWKFKAEDSVFASPIVSGGVVYVGAGNLESREQRRNFYALDSGTGQELWRFLTDGRVLVPAAIGNGAIYFSSSSGNSEKLYAVH